MYVYLLINNLLNMKWRKLQEVSATFNALTLLGGGRVEISSSEIGKVYTLYVMQRVIPESINLSRGFVKFSLLAFVCLFCTVSQCFV